MDIHAYFYDIYIYAHSWYFFILILAVIVPA